MHELSERKKALFSKIVEEYVATAKPVGSKSIVDSGKFEVSSATVRNEMKELEDMGFITHPHTSAGRIPTAEGYHYYVKHFLNPEAQLQKKSAEVLEQLIDVESNEPELLVKGLARGIAEVSDEAVLVSLSEYSFYYTGISNIFRKPEFADTEVMYTLSELVDHFDDVMPQLVVPDTIEIFIGERNPVSTLCSLLVTEYQASEDTSGIIAILGPVRMQYQHNYNLLKYVKNILTK